MINSILEVGSQKIYGKNNSNLDGFQEKLDKNLGYFLKI